MCFPLCSKQRRHYIAPYVKGQCPAIVHKTLRKGLKQYFIKNIMEHGSSKFFLYYFQYFLRFNTLYTTGSGFGGLEVSVLAFDTQVRGFKPGEKILSAPSFGGEVKPSVPCRKFTACKRTEKWRESRHFRQNSRQFLAHSSTFRCWGSLASFQAWGTPGGGSWNALITGPPSSGLDVPLATALCKNLPAENTQR